jgi:type II secretory pathway pseudopilin PulG
MSMRERLRQEDGFSLPELLTTLMIGMVLVLASLSLVEVTMRRTGETQDRIEALQGGRLALDTITRELRSRVCLPLTGGADPIQVSIASASPDAVAFYVDMRDTSAGGSAATPPSGYISGPQKRSLTYVYDAVAKTGKLVEAIYWPSKVLDGVYSYNATPNSTRELLVNVQRAQGTLNGATVTVPIFQYFQYDFGQSDAANETPGPDYEVTNLADATLPLSDDQARTVAKIRITFRANARKRIDGKASTVFTDEVFTRNVDPNAETDELSEPCK